MKNKKLAISLLSTAVLSSMTASAFAAEEGIYIGGDVDHYYQIDAFLNTALFEQIQDDLDLVEADQIVYVDDRGMAATFAELFKAGPNDDVFSDDLEGVFGDDAHDEYAGFDGNGEEIDSQIPVPGVDPDFGIADADAAVGEDLKVTISGESNGAEDVKVVLYGPDAEEGVEYTTDNGVELNEDGTFTFTTPAALAEGDWEYEVFAVDADGNDSEPFTGDFKVEKAAAGDIVVESVSAITSKSLKVVFNQAVDTTKAVVEVKRDGNKANYSTVTWNADKTEATIELTSKLVKGEYVVNVTGLVEGKTLTGSTVADDEKVTKINLPSETVPRSADGLKAVVSFKIENQYGEDITKTGALNVYAAGAVAGVPNYVKGTIELTPTAGTFKDGDKIVLTLIDAPSTVSTTKTVTIASAAAASDVTVSGLYNKDGKVLSEDTVLGTNAFYIPVDVKDQYGNSITELAKLNGTVANNYQDAEVIVTNTNQLVAVASKFELITIDNKQVAAIKVEAGPGGLMAGETTVTVIVKATAKNASTKITVAEATRSDAVSLSAPAGLVVAGEDIYLPLTVTDKKGNPITDINLIKNNGTKGVTVSGTNTLSIEEKDGGIYVKVTGITDGQAISVVAVSSTNKVATYTAIAKPAAAPKVITGTTASTSLRPLTPVTIDYTKIKVEDQYGRVLPADKLKTALDNNWVIKAGILGADSKFEYVGGTEIKKTGATYSTITVKAKDSATKVTENISFVLVDPSNNQIPSSAFDVKFSIVPDVEFASYKVSDIDPVYVLTNATTGDVTGIDTDYEAAIEVTAVTKDGGEVTLTEGQDYTVKSLVLADVDDSVIDGADANGVPFAPGAATGVASFTVTINATGQEITKNVTFSKVKPKATKIEVVENNSAAAYVAGTAAAKPLSKFTYDSAITFGMTQLLANADIVVIDQYGVKKAFDEAAGEVEFADVTITNPTLLLTKVSGTELTFASNGTVGAQVTKASAGAIFNTRFDLAGVSATPVAVTAKQAITTP